jgi:hypothetical protein
MFANLIRFPFRVPQTPYYAELVMPLEEWDPWELPDDNSNPDDFREDCDDD